MSRRQIHSNIEFKQRFGKINWNQIIQLDLDSILSHGDIESLQGILENLTYSTLDRDDIERIGDSNLIKVFKLSQLSIEYLIGIHSQLDISGKEFVSKQKKYYDENQVLKESLVELEKEVSSLKSEFLEKKKAVQTYELLLKQPGTGAIMNKVVTRANAVTCEYCKKAFISHEFLEEHKKRRHVGDISRDSAPSFDINPFLEIFKTFTEQRIQSVTENHRREIESLKELMKIQLEIQKDHEITSFQKLMLMQSQTTNLHEDMYNKLLIETQFEKEKLSQVITEDIKRIEERDKILMNLKSAHEALSREVTEKEGDLQEFIIASHENSISNEIDVISQPFTQGSPKGDENNYEERVSTPIPQQLMKKVSQKLSFENMAPEVAKQIIIPINVEESYDYDIPVLSEIRSRSEVTIPQKSFEAESVSLHKQIEPEVLISHHAISSNAGDIETDSEIDDEQEEDITQKSNAGDIVTDSDESLELDYEDKANFKIVQEESKIIDKSRLRIEVSPPGEIEVVSINSEKIEPKAFVADQQYTEIVSDIEVNRKIEEEGSDQFIREKIAKEIGIDPKKEKNYMYLVDEFIAAQMPYPWKIQPGGYQISYINEETGQETKENPKIPVFSKRVADLKKTYRDIYEKIILLNKEPENIRKNKNNKEIASYFNHNLEEFEKRKKKLLEDITLGRVDKEFNQKISQRDLKKQKKSLEIYLKKVISNQILVDKSKEFVNNFKELSAKKEEKSSELSSFRIKDAENEKKNWNYNQGINLIQNRNVLKESARITSGQYFQEGNLLGEQYFGKNSGLDLEENLLEKVRYR